MAFKPPPNYLVRAERTCLGTEMLIFAEAFLPVFLFGLWTVISPGWKDFIRMGTGRSWSHHARRYFEEVEKTEQNWLTKTGRTLGTIAAPLDRALWWCAAVEGATFIMTHWVSMAWRLNPCPAPGDSLWGKSKLPLDGRPTNYDWQTGPSFIAEEGNIVPFISPNVQIQPGETGTLMIGARFEGFLDHQPLAVDMRIVDEDGNVQDFDTYDGEHYDDRFNGPMCYARIDGGAVHRSLRCEVRLHEGQSPLVWAAFAGYIGVRVDRSRV